MLTDFKTGDVHSMIETFSNCEQLEYIDISSFQTGNVKKRSEKRTGLNSTDYRI